MTTLTPRCRPCARNGYTNLRVVSLATQHTPNVDDGDFLCIFHNHATATPWQGGTNN